MQLQPISNLKRSVQSCKNIVKLNASCQLLQNHTRHNLETGEASYKGSE